VVDQDFGDTRSDPLQDGTRNHRVASEREDIIHCGAIAERPALDGVCGSESVDDLHTLQLSCLCERRRDIQLALLDARIFTRVLQFTQARELNNDAPATHTASGALTA
jgi:hypothetical protein